MEENTKETITKLAEKVFEILAEHPEIVTPPIGCGPPPTTALNTILFFAEIRRRIACLGFWKTLVERKGWKLQKCAKKFRILDGNDKVRVLGSADEVIKALEEVIEISKKYESKKSKFAGTQTAEENSQDED